MKYSYKQGEKCAYLVPGAWYLVHIHTYLEVQRTSRRYFFMGCPRATRYNHPTTVPDWSRPFLQTFRLRQLYFFWRRWSPVDNASLSDTSIAPHKNFDHWRRLRGCGHGRVPSLSTSKKENASPKTLTTGILDAAPQRLIGGALTRVVNAMWYRRPHSMLSFSAHAWCPCALRVSWLPYQAWLWERSK